MFVFSIGVATFKSQLDGSAGQEVELDLAGGRLEGQEVAALRGCLPDVAQIRCLMEG